VILGPGANGTRRTVRGSPLRDAVSVPCGQTEEGAAADPTAVTLYSLQRIDDTDAYVRPAAGLEGLCDDPGCGVEGWAGRAIPVAQDILTSTDEYTFDDGFGADVYSLLPAALIGAVTRLFLDLERFDGDVPTTYSPWDGIMGTPAQRVEYHASYTASWTPRGGGSPYSVGGHLWLCEGRGLIVSLETTGVDLLSDPPPERLNVPAGLPEGSALTAAVVFLWYEFDFDPCDLTGGTEGETVANALDGSHDRTWSLSHTPGVDPP
jgi:hypothetical protein